LKPKAADLVPVYAPEYEKGPPYLVFGGLVFSRLTLAYLGEYGDEWWNQAPRPLVNKAMLEYQKKKDQEIVILSHVLVDDCNLYEPSSLVFCCLCVALTRLNSQVDTITI